MSQGITGMCVSVAESRANARFMLFFFYNEKYDRLTFWGSLFSVVVVEWNDTF